MPTVDANKEQSHLRLRPPSLALKENSFAMTTLRAFLIRTRLLSVEILTEQFDAS